MFSVGGENVAPLPTNNEIGLPLDSYSVQRSGWIRHSQGLLRLSSQFDNDQGGFEDEPRESLRGHRRKFPAL